MSDYTFAERSELFARVELVSGQFESALAELRGSSPKPESVDARAAALSAIDDARLVLTQKRDALGYATAETWQSAKSEFLTAWQSVLASYLKAKSASN